MLSRASRAASLRAMVNENAIVMKSSLFDSILYVKVVKSEWFHLLKEFEEDEQPAGQEGMAHPILTRDLPFTDAMLTTIQALSQKTAHVESIDPTLMDSFYADCYDPVLFAYRLADEWDAVSANATLFFGLSFSLWQCYFCYCYSATFHLFTLGQSRRHSFYPVVRSRSSHSPCCMIAHYSTVHWICFPRYPDMQLCYIKKRSVFTSCTVYRVSFYFLIYES